MYVSIKKELLVKTLAHANRIIEKRQASPVFGCVLFDANNDYIKITATNMDMTIIDIIAFNPANCIINESGTYCLPVSLLYEISKKFSNNSNIVLQSNINTNEIKITNNKTSFSIHYIDSSSFPPLELINDNNDYIDFQMRTEDLKNAIDITKVAMSQDIIRTQLNGIYIHYNEQDNTLRFVATDLFRISCTSINAPKNTNNIKPVVISKKTVMELLHMLSDINKNDIVNIKINEKQIILEANISNDIKSIYSSRVVTGSFPEYKTALEINNNKLLVVNVKDFINAIDRVDTIVSDVSNSIQLNINNNKLTISGVSKELGSAIEELECKYYCNITANQNNSADIKNSSNTLEDCTMQDSNYDVLINNEDILNDNECALHNNDDILNSDYQSEDYDWNYNSDSDMNISNEEQSGIDSDYSASNKEINNSTDGAIPSNSEHNEFKICFNSKYLLELIKPISTNEVYMYLNTSVSPTIIKPDPNKIDGTLSLVSVIMPVEIVHN